MTFLLPNPALKTALVITCLCLPSPVLALSEEPIVPADITKLFEKRELHNAVLMNNFAGRLIDQKTKTLKGTLPHWEHL